MSATDAYLLRIREALESGDEDQIGDLGDEIHGAYTEQIPTIGKYERDENGPTPIGLKQLRGKLIAYRESCDDRLYGNYGLASITDSIRQLEDAMNGGLSSDKLLALYKRIDHIYAEDLPSYTGGLCGWLFLDDNPCDEQTQLRIGKLRYYRDEKYRELKLAEAQRSNVSVASTNSNTNNQIQSTVVQVDITTTFERIDQLPDDSLSDEGKTALKGMLGDLSTKDEKKREGKLQKLLHWLGDKGVDVAIAVLPYVIKAINPDLAG